MRGIVFVLLLLAAWLLLELLLRRVKLRVARLRRESPLFAALYTMASGTAPPRTEVPPQAAAPRQERAAERMVRCRRCGVHFVERLGATAADGTVFCSPACRDAPRG